MMRFFRRFKCYVALFD